MAAFCHPLEEHVRRYPDLREKLSYQNHWRTTQLLAYEGWNRFMKTWSEPG